MKKIVLAFPIIALVAGCAAPYQPPTAGDTSSVNFVPMLSGTVFVFIHEGDDVKTCTNGKQIARLSNGERISAAVTDGKKIVLRMRQMLAQGMSYSTCDIAVEFTPESGKKYVLTQGIRGQCAATLRDDNGPVRATRREVTPSTFANDVSWCKPAAD